ncbi:hypothetical protein OEZ86_009337 [Tetradesmus obliquus]|nr:hypothetical protein OEZ86_009337 [Tetradesmus obliquus]
MGDAAPTICDYDVLRPWILDVVRARKQRALQQGLRKADIPPIQLQWTGDELADTMAALQTVVAEGEADHIPVHLRAYRIAKLNEHFNPGSSIQEALSRLRPLEGNTCPVVLAVPPPDPLTPAHAAAAAAAAAASSHMPAAAEEFDPHRSACRNFKKGA